MVLCHVLSEGHPGLRTASYVAEVALAFSSFQLSLHVPFAWHHDIRLELTDSVPGKVFFMLSQTVVRERLSGVWTGLVCACSIVVGSDFTLHFWAFSSVLVPLKVIFEGLTAQELGKTRAIWIHALAQLGPLSLSTDWLRRHPVLKDGGNIGQPLVFLVYPLNELNLKFWGADRRQLKHR